MYYSAFEMAVHNVFDGWLEMRSAQPAWFCANAFGSLAVRCNTPSAISILLGLGWLAGYLVIIVEYHFH